MMNNALLMMVDKDAVGTEVYEMLQMMNKTTEEVFLLLDNLLKWAKRRLNKQRIFKQNVDIHEIIRSTASLYSTMAEQKKIRITTEGIDGEAIGFVDEDMMKTVVRNLVSNAMKFCFEGGEIHIASVQEGDFIHVSVKDNGCRIQRMSLFHCSFNDSRNILFLNLLK